MLILTVTDLTKHYGGNTVFEGLSWQIGKGKKIGLVGANGAGKSTLFKLIAAELQPDEGSIWRHPGATVGYMPQEPQLDPDQSVLQAALQASPAIAALEAQIQSLEDSLSEPEVYGDMNRLGQVMEP